MTTPVRSVVQALAILRLLAEGPAKTLSEIAAASGISPSSCLGLVRTLVGEGVLTLGSGKRYALAPNWRAIPALRHDYVARLVDRMRPQLAAAAREWQAPVGLWREVPGERLQLLALGESEASTRIHMVEGQRQPIGTGAVGRALAALQGVGPAELERRYAAVRWHRPISLTAYAASVAEAARRGFAVDDGLSNAGITSLAVGARTGDMEVCLSVSVFTGALTPSQLDALGERLCALRVEAS